MNVRSHSRRRDTFKQRGIITPMLVVASCVALVLDHLWMDAVWSN